MNVSTGDMEERAAKIFTEKNNLYAKKEPEKAEPFMLLMPTKVFAP